MFYHYSQNNSGGKFIGPNHILIEADSAKHANWIAEDNDIYFDGVEKGIDCGCCGDRWYPCWGGSEFPALYGRKVAFAETCETEATKALSTKRDGVEAGVRILVIMKDGTKKIGVEIEEDSPIKS